MPASTGRLPPVVEVDLGPAVRAGFSTRGGGVSRPPYDALNLGARVGDDPDAVARQPRAARAVGGRAGGVRTQVHGPTVGCSAPPPAEPSVGEADALVSVSPARRGRGAGRRLRARAAGRLRGAGVVAAVHAGRRGLVAGVVQAAVAAMVAQGADAGRIRAAVGPAIAGDSYEVPAELRTRSPPSSRSHVVDDRVGHAGARPAGRRRRGAGAGRVSCTWTSRAGHVDGPALFSFRRSPRTGRFAGVVRPPLADGAAANAEAVGRVAVRCCVAVASVTGRGSPSVAVYHRRRAPGWSGEIRGGSQGDGRSAAQDDAVPRPGRRPVRARGVPRGVRRRGGRGAAGVRGPGHAAAPADAPSLPAAAPQSPVAGELRRITTIHPRSYNDARKIGEAFREGTPVIMNLTDMDDADAKRLVDFSAGLIFGLHGAIERVTSKVFLLSPAHVEVAGEAAGPAAEPPTRAGFYNQS